MKKEKVLQQCVVCGKDFWSLGKRKFCLSPCRVLPRPRTAGKCKFCGNDFMGIKSKKFCCHNCAIKYYQSLKRNNQ